MPSYPTQFRFSTDSVTAVVADALILPVYQKAAPKTAGSGKSAQKQADWTVTHAAVDKALQGMITATATEEKFDAGLGKTMLFRKTPGDRLKARRVVVVGLGAPKDLRPEKVESAILKAVQAALTLDGLASLAVTVPDAPKGMAQFSFCQAIVDAVHQSTYRSLEAKEPGPKVKTVDFLPPGPPTADCKKALKLAEVFAQAKSAAKDLTNMPANLKSTQTMVNKAKEIGKLGGKSPVVSVSVQSSAAWIEKNMPCFFEVARGSLASDPPKWITLHYKPKSGKIKKKIALIGKSVIFDTGGYQVKTGDYMNTMKGDMTGGATVLAVMEAIGKLQPAGVEVFCYLAATPNKIDANAMIPDSIVGTTCGKKVEIRHTDAEGRLTLIDAVAMAARQKPDVIVTTATLTGSASRFVGCRIALMGNDDAWRNKVEAAARHVGDPIQALTVEEEDWDAIKSKLDGADIINTSQSNSRGAQSAAAFVMSGAPEGIPVVHLDIAGADMTKDEKATGITPKALLQFVLTEGG